MGLVSKFTLLGWHETPNLKTECNDCRSVMTQSTWKEQSQISEEMNLNPSLKGLSQKSFNAHKLTGKRSQAHEETNGHG